MTKAHKGILGADRTVTYLDFCGSYTTLHICQNSQNFTKKGAFTVCKLHFNRNNTKKILSLLKTIIQSS